MKKILSVARGAIEKYNMIHDGDVIAVGVSGGKDSLVLLKALAVLRKFLPSKFEVKAITVDPGFGGRKGDFSKVAEFCKSNDVEYIVKETRLSTVIFDERKENNPCSLCSRMRRGILSRTAKESGCNVLALGHNFDDAAETFIMNLFNGGNVSCFSPVSYMSRAQIKVIRPLIFADEKLIVSACKRNNMPVVISDCPVNEKTNREDTKMLLANLEKTYPSLRSKIVGAMQRSHISNW